MVRQLCSRSTPSSSFCGNPDYPLEKSDAENIFVFCTRCRSARRSRREPRQVRPVHESCAWRPCPTGSSTITYSRPRRSAGEVDRPRARVRGAVALRVLQDHRADQGLGAVHAPPRAAGAAPPILFVGESGTSKTVCVSATSRSSTPRQLDAHDGLSSRTTSMDVQVNIEANVDKRGQRVRPARRQEARHLHRRHEHAQGRHVRHSSPSAAAHAHVARLHLRPREGPQPEAVEGPPADRRDGPARRRPQPVDPRFTALFNVYNLPPPTDEVLSGMYDAILEARYANFSGPIKDLSTKFWSRRSACSSLCSALPPTPSSSLHLQPARPLARVRGHVPRDRGRVQGLGERRAAVPQRVLPHLLRPAHVRGRPQARQRQDQ